MPDHDETYPAHPGGLGYVMDGAHDGAHDTGHEPAYESRSQRRAAQQHHSRRRRSRGRRWVVLLVAVVLVGGAAYGAYAGLGGMISQLTASDDYPGPGTGSVTVDIPDGATGRAIGRALEDAGVVKSASAFVDAANGNPKSSSIQPGRYTLKRQMSADGALTLLLDPSSRSTDRVTVREGLRVSEILPLLAKQTGQPLADYKAALKDPEALGIPAAAKGKPEGWLFPDTYEFGDDKSAAQQLKTMVARTHQVLDDLGVDASDAQRVLTVASIAEVEAASPEDYAKVARVLQNRLDDQLHNGGKLQLDSTVAYAVGKRQLTTTAAERAVDSPYNTYRYPGLPAGPISNPGRAAIEGALKPADGPWLFFVTVDPSTGETKFATTAAEHQQYVQQFRSWCQAHPGKC